MSTLSANVFVELEKNEYEDDGLGPCKSQPSRTDPSKAARRPSKGDSHPAFFRSSNTLKMLWGPSKKKKI